MRAGTRHARGSEIVLILTLVAIASVSPLAISVVVPSLPSIRNTFATDPASVQLVLSGYLIAIAIGQLFVGPLADRYGRRPVLLVGYAVFALACFAAALSLSAGMLIGARILQGLGGCAGVVVSRAVIRDLYDREQSASVLGYVTMGLAIAPMIGPFVGGTIDDALGWRTVFVCVALLTIAVMIGSWAVLPETKPEHTGRTWTTILRDIAALISIPAFWAYALTSALTSCVYFAFLGGAPFIATEVLGLNAAELGFNLLFVSVGYFFGNFVSGRFARRLGVMRMIYLGNGVLMLTAITIVSLFAAGWVTPWTLFLPVAFVGVANGISLPSAVAGSVSVRPDLAGTASGFGGSIQFGISGLASLAAGAAIAISPSAVTLGIVMLGFAIAGTLMGVWAQFARH